MAKEVTLLSYRDYIYSKSQALKLLHGSNVRLDRRIGKLADVAANELPLYGNRFLMASTSY